MFTEEMNLPVKESSCHFIFTTSQDGFVCLRGNYIDLSSIILKMTLNCFQRQNCIFTQLVYGQSNRTKWGSLSQWKLQWCTDMDEIVCFFMCSLCVCVDPGGPEWFRC